MPDADAAASPAAAVGAEAAAGEAQEAAPQRTDFLAAGPNYLDLSQLSDDFAPLSSRGQKPGKKRQRQVQPGTCRASRATVVCIMLGSPNHLAVHCNWAGLKALNADVSQRVGSRT
jgi:hypothetical protein